MKTTKVLTVVAIVATLLFAENTKAQVDQNKPLNMPDNKSSYRTAIGVRGGGTSGLTIKQLSGQNAIEGIVGMWGSGFSLTGLYERYVPAGVDGLNWYYGGGGHVAFSTGKIYNNNSRYLDYYDGKDGGVGLGLDGIVGLEYKISPIPFAISLDLKPFFEVNTMGGTYVALDPGIGIKLAF